MHRATYPPVFLQPLVAAWGNSRAWGHITPISASLLTWPPPPGVRISSLCLCVTGAFVVAFRANPDNLVSHLTSKSLITPEKTLSSANTSPWWSELSWRLEKTSMRNSFVTWAMSIKRDKTPSMSRPHRAPCWAPGRQCTVRRHCFSYSRAHEPAGNR